jgi:hypothetical protein
LGYLLILLGLGVLGVALAALVRGQIGWARIPNRKTAVVTMIVGVGVGVVVFGVGGALTPQSPSGTAANRATSPARSAPSVTSTIATTAPTATANPGSETPQAGGGNTVAAPGLADSVWDTLAQCESGGNWAINTGNGLYGGLQLDRGAWLSNGGAAYAPLPSDATRPQQILIAEKVRAERGFSPWSSCARKLGLR